VFRTLYDSGVKFTINTDNPSMLNTSVANEIDILRRNNILSEAEINQTIQWAREAAFVPTEPGKNLYL